MIVHRVPTLGSEFKVPEIQFHSSFGGPANVEAVCGLAATEDVLLVHFRVQAIPYYNPEFTAGVYREGLWRYDCGELWLASPETGRYIELNLAPNGAWWSMVFRVARQRDLNCAPPACVTESQIREEQWEASLRISWSEINRCLGDKGIPTANVTLVLGGCPDGDVPPENLHSIVDLRGERPDFHRPQDWTRLHFVG